MLVDYGHQLLVSNLGQFLVQSLQFKCGTDLEDFLVVGTLDQVLQIKLKFEVFMTASKSFTRNRTPRIWLCV